MELRHRMREPRGEAARVTLRLRTHSHEHLLHSHNPLSEICFDS